MTIIFSNIEAFAGIKAALPVTTTGQVALGTPTVAADGRCAVDYEFCDEDLEEIEAVGAGLGFAVDRGAGLVTAEPALRQGAPMEMGGSIPQARVQFSETGLPEDWEAAGEPAP